MVENQLNPTTFKKRTDKNNDQNGISKISHFNQKRGLNQHIGGNSTNYNYRYEIKQE